MRTQYAQGIDRAPKCVSTKVEKIVIPPPPRDPEEFDPYAKYDRDNPQSAWNRYLEYTRNPQLKYQRHLHFNETKLTAGQVLAARRKEQLEQRIEYDRLGISPPSRSSSPSSHAALAAIKNTAADESGVDGESDKDVKQSRPSVSQPSGETHERSVSSAKPRGHSTLPFNLPMIVEVKMHEHSYPPGHLDAVRAAHIAVNGLHHDDKNKKGKNKRKSVETTRLRRLSANAFTTSTTTGT